MAIDISIGQVTGNYQGNAVNTTKNTRFIQVRAKGKIQSWQDVFGATGIDSCPSVGAVVASIDSGDLQFAVSGDDFIPKIAMPGEIRIYSSDGNGNLQASVYLKANGLIQIQNQTANLLTVLSNLVSALTSWTSINCVNGSPVTPNPATVQALNNIVTQLQGLLV